MYKKIIGVLVCTLLIVVAVLPVMGTNNDENHEIKLAIKPHEEPKQIPITKDSNIAPPLIAIEIQYFFAQKAKVYPSNLIDIMKSDKQTFIFAQIKGYGICSIRCYLYIWIDKDNLPIRIPLRSMSFTHNITLTMLLEINFEFSIVNYDDYDGEYYSQLHFKFIYCRLYHVVIR